jgi:hypothetical protein
MNRYISYLDKLEEKAKLNPLDKSIELARSRMSKSLLADTLHKKLSSVKDLPALNPERNISDKIITSLTGIPYKQSVDLTNSEVQVPADENPIPFGRTIDTLKPLNKLDQIISNKPSVDNVDPQTSNRIIDDLDKEKVPGDVGKAGTFIKGIAPTIFSAIDAFTTKDNVNAYQDYGRDGLETLDTAKRDLNISLNQGKNDITNQIAGAKLANNNSTRSLNVARALNLSSDLIGQDAQNKLAAQTADRRINLDTVIANAENQRDSVVMKGADEKQVRDAEDRSKIISNFSGAAQAIGSSKEHIGKMVNEGNYNDDFLSTLGALFPNMNIGKDAKGNLTFTRKKAVG